MDSISNIKVLAGGCFNSIHPGHVQFLKKAKSLGDFLVVVIAHDEHNKKPYAIPANQRKAALEKLGIADKIVIGDADDFSRVILAEKPQIIALGYDQELLEKTIEVARQLKINVVRIEMFGTYSTRTQPKNH
jgi:FAD synthetase